MKVKTIIVIYLWTILTEITGETSRILKKRQIYREQVLPHAGGKIPGSAFNVDRLALNRLQSQGIAVPDGILLEQRRYQVYHYPQKRWRPVYKVALTPSNRYTSPEGTYHHNEIPSVDTTYPVPQITGHKLKLPPKIPFKPKYVSFQLPHPEVNGVYLQSKPQVYAYPLSYSGGYPSHGANAYHYPSPTLKIPQTAAAFRQQQLQHLALPAFDDQHLIPLTPYGWSPFKDDYVASSIFGDFEKFFTDLHKRPTDNDAWSDESRIIDLHSREVRQHKRANDAATDEGLTVPK